MERLYSSGYRRSGGERTGRTLKPNPTPVPPAGRVGQFGTSRFDSTAAEEGEERHAM